MRLLALHGTIDPKKPWPVTDASQVYVGKLKFYNLGAWLGTLGPIESQWENRKPKCKNQESKCTPNAFVGSSSLWYASHSALNHWRVVSCYRSAVHHWSVVISCSALHLASWNVMGAVVDVFQNHLRLLSITRAIIYSHVS